MQVMGVIVVYSEKWFEAVTSNVRCGKDPIIVPVLTIEEALHSPGLLIWYLP